MFVTGSLGLPTLIAAEASRSAKVPRIRFLRSSPRSLTAFQPGLREAGYVLDLKTAKALGVAIPPSVLARADELIRD